MNISGIPISNLDPKLEVEALGLVKGQGRRVSSDKPTLYRKECNVKKCCYLCSEFPLCTNQKGENPYIMVCWDFKLKKELAI